MQLRSQMHLSQGWEVAMTRIIYPYTWVNMRDNELSYTLICKKGHAPWTLSVYLPSGIYRAAEDVVHVMFSGPHNSLKGSYLKSDKILKSRRKRVLLHTHESS